MDRLQLVCSTTVFFIGSMIVDIPGDPINNRPPIEIKPDKLLAYKLKIYSRSGNAVCT